MAQIPTEPPEHHAELVLRDKSRACKQRFMECLEAPIFESDDWLEQKSAEFNWWISGLEADESGPGSLDARLKLRPDVRDVLTDVLDGLESALSKFYRIATSNSQLFGTSSTSLADNIRPPSPWSDMSDSSNADSSLSSWKEEEHEKEAHNDVPPVGDVCHEQRVYIDTNLQILIRIHAAIKRSGLKFRNQRADDSLKRADEFFQSEKARVGERRALLDEGGKHERFRLYLTTLILCDAYTQCFVQRMSSKVDDMTQAFIYYGRQYPELLLREKVLIVVRAYLYDKARLTKVQRRLINANVIRRNRLIYTSSATKASFEAQTHYLPQSLADQTRRIWQLIAPPDWPQVEDKNYQYFGRPPATAPGSIYKIANTQIYLGARNLDYPKCPVKEGQFTCPYCQTILAEEYTKQEKWREHVAQDLGPYICVFEDCDSEDEMFASTSEWMSHMARFHSETEWVCHKCTKQPAQGVRSDSVFQNPTLLGEHISAFHSPLDDSELGLLVDAGKQLTGIQRVKCPLCRAGLVALEKDKDEDNMDSSLTTGREIGLIQLEQDEHIATHIHEFALHSFPFPREDPWSYLSPTRRVEITLEGLGGLETSRIPGLQCPWSKCFPALYDSGQYKDIERVCARISFRNFRTLRYHLQKYHSRRLNCGICGHCFDHGDIPPLWTLKPLKEKHDETYHSDNAEPQSPDSAVTSFVLSGDGYERLEQWEPSQDRYSKERGRFGAPALITEKAEEMHMNNAEELGS